MVPVHTTLTRFSPGPRIAQQALQRSKLGFMKMSRCIFFIPVPLYIQGPFRTYGCVCGPELGPFRSLASGASNSLASAGRSFDVPCLPRVLEPRLPVFQDREAREMVAMAAIQSREERERAESKKDDRDDSVNGGDDRDRDRDSSDRRRGRCVHGSRGL